MIKKLNLFLIALILIASCTEKDDPKPVPAELVADAGPDQKVKSGETVTLDGSRSSDSKSKSLTFEWTILNKPATSKVSLSSTTIANPTFIADVEGEYEFELEVTGENGSDKDKVLVTVESAAFTPFEIFSIETETILEDRTTHPDVPDYIVDEFVSVDARLIVKPGVVIGFTEDAYMQISDGGAIIAKGEANSKIRFTGIKNQEGFWRGIIFYSGSSANEFSNVEILNAGSISMLSNISAAVTVADRARLTIKNTLISGSGGYGINLMEGSLVNEFSNNTLSNNEAPILLFADHVVKLDAASSFSQGNERNAIEIPTSSINGTEEVTWPAFDDNTPYRFIGTVTAQTGWVLSPGVTIEVASDNYFDIGKGYIKAIGTPERKITVTGVDKTKASWRGIILWNNGNIMENVEISYAGSSPLISDATGSIAVTDNSSLTIKNSKITNSGGYGIIVGSTATINDDVETVNSFSDNALENIDHQ